MNAQTTSPSSQCGFNLDSASQRGLYRLGPRVCHLSGRHTLQSANLDFLSLDAEEIATLPRFTPWQTEKISSSRDLDSRPYELVKAHYISQVDRRPLRHDGPALTAMAHRLLVQVCKQSAIPGEKWIGNCPASSTEATVLARGPRPSLLGKAYADGESDRFASMGLFGLVWEDNISPQYFCMVEQQNHFTLSEA